MIALFGVAWRLRWLILAAALAGALWWWIGSIRAAAHAAGRAEAVAEYQAATAAEAARRNAELEASHRAGLALAFDNAEKDRRYASLKARLAALSAARDGAVCLDRDGVRRVNQARRPPG